MQPLTPTQRVRFHRPAVAFATAQALAAPEPESQLDRKHRINKELRAVGVSRYGLGYTEIDQLPLVIHQYEHIRGAIYGQADDGLALLVATDMRVLFIDKKPLFLKSVEISYDLVGGISYGKVGWFATVTLHTRIGDFRLKTMNLASAQRFIAYIETRCLEHKLQDQSAAPQVWRA